MGRGKRSQGLRAAIRHKVDLAIAGEHVRQSAHWHTLSDDSGTRRWAQEGLCLVCGEVRQQGSSLCSEHHDEVLQNALDSIAQQRERSTLLKDLVEDCPHCTRKTRYMCGHCQAKGVRPRKGYLWCWSCNGVGEWGPHRDGCAVCQKTGYLSEGATRAKLGPTYDALLTMLAGLGREIREQRLSIWEHEHMLHGLDISSSDEVLRYTISLDGHVESCELVAG